MEMDMAQDCQNITVHAMSPVHRMGPAFYASLPHETRPPDGRHEIRGTGIRRRLVSMLWEHLARSDSLDWNSRHSQDGAVSAIQVVRDALGKPHLMLGECRGPAISFSEGGGAVWAALCGDDSEIGIDVAETDEFQGNYPFHRVFHAQELQNIVRLAGGGMERASALLWSIKEAIVKALGCGFALVEPCEVHVQQITDADGEYTFEARLASKALERLPLGAGRRISVRSVPSAKNWLSIAFLKWQRPRGEGGSIVIPSPRGHEI
jgi:phosphopantetheinyl transferase